MIRNMEAKTHRMVWCAATSRYRCMTCGRSSEKMKMPGMCEGPKVHVGGHDRVRRAGPKGEALVWCRNCSGYARRRPCPKLLNRMQAIENITKERGSTLKRILKLEEGEIPDSEAQGLKIDGEQRKVKRKEC